MKSTTIAISILHFYTRDMTNSVFQYIKQMGKKANGDHLVWTIDIMLLNI